MAAPYQRRCRQCGNPLSRYNDGDECAACAAARRDLSAASVPPELWLSDEMRQALGRWDWRTVFGLVTTATHMSQSTLGGLIGISQPQVSRIMKGTSAVFDIRVINNIVDGLGAPRDLAGLAPTTPDNGDTVAVGSVDGLESGMVSAVDRGGDDDVDLSAAHVRRRSLLRGLAAVTAAAGIVGVGRGPRRRIGMADVARLAALTSLYRLADQEFGGGGLFDEVGRFAESASELLDHEVNDALRPQLLVAIASARDLAGWTAFDATRHSDAQRHFAAAERFAIDAGDRQVAAHVRYGQAKQMQHLRHNRDALEILRGAHHQLDATPALTTILRGAEASSRAAIGDWEGAKRSLGLASEAFTDVDAGSEPEWLGFLDKGELLAQYGRVYRDWARADRRHGGDAVRWVTDAISAFGPQNTRSTVLNQVGLASAYFLADAPDLALQAGDTAQRQAATLTSPRVIERLANLRRDAAQHTHLPEVADFVRALPRPTPVA